MNKFKVGNRVAVYGSITPREGGTCHYSSGMRGTITKVSIVDCEVDLDINPFGRTEGKIIDQVHAKQCRRLRKKSLKRVYALYPTYGSSSMIVFFDKAEAEKVSISACYEGMVEIREFVEARKKL